MAEWQPCCLGDLVDVKHGFAFDGVHFKEIPPGDVLLTPGNFAIGGGFQAKKLKYYDGPVPKEFVLNPGDLLVTMTDLSKEADTLGFPAIVPGDGRRYLHNQRLGKVILRPDAPTTPQYVQWLLRTQEYRHEIIASSSGSTVRHTSPSRIMAYRFLLPPLYEQAKISAILGSLDNKIDLNRRMNETLEAIARAIFKDWIVDFGPTHAKMEGRTPYLSPDIWSLFPDRLDDQGKPEGWLQIPLREVSEIHSGGTPSKTRPEYWHGTIPWISPKVMTGIHVNESNDRVTSAAIGNGTRLVPAGTALVMVRGMGLHQGVRISQLRRDATFNQDVKALVPRRITASHLLFALLAQASNLLSRVESSGHGTGVLPTRFIEDLELTLPSATSYGKITAIFDDIDSSIASNAEENATLSSLRDLLLPKLMSGEIRIKNTERVLEEVL